MRNKIKIVMEDMLQRNCICDYTIIQNDLKIYRQNIRALDAYMEAYSMSTNGDVYCYMTPDGKRAYGAIFSVVNGTVTLSGQIIK